MITTVDKNEIIAGVEKAVHRITQLMAAVKDQRVNTVPYEGSWTAPQLMRHVSKSVIGMARTLRKEGIAGDRDPGARIEELRGIFLNFTNKLKSPDFIIPEDGPYEKQSSIDELNAAFDQFRQSAENIDINEIMEGLPFGPVTKLEIICFTLFHTERHLYQMERICKALNEKIICNLLRPTGRHPGGPVRLAVIRAGQ